MRTFIIDFDYLKNRLHLQDNDKLVRSLRAPKTNNLKIDLVEIWNTENPSRIVIEINNNDATKYIHLYQYRINFLLQNNIFFWDTSKLSEFNLDVSQMDFSIKVRSDEDFRIRMYGYTDQEARLPDVIMI